MVAFHRFSHHALRALSHAEEVVARHRHAHKDTGHLLLGVLLTEGSLGAQVLNDLDLPRDVVEVYLKRLVPTIDDPDITPDDHAFNAALGVAEDESNWLGHHYIGTEHLLLGITRTNIGNAASLMRLLDVTPEQLRRRVRQVLSDGLTEFSLNTIRLNARVSELSRRVLNAAEQIAMDRQHPMVGMGHLLLAMHRERRGVTSAFLRSSGLDGERLEHDMETGSGEYLLIGIEEVTQAAIDQAEKLGSHYVGADHLLLAVTLAPSGHALLSAYGVAPDKVKRLLNKHLKA